MIIDHFCFIKSELLTLVSIQLIKSKKQTKKNIQTCTKKVWKNKESRERWINLLHVEDLHWTPLLLSYSTGRSGAAEQKRRAPSKRWGWRRRVEERGTQPWTEKLRGKRGRKYNGRERFNMEIQGICASIRGGHTVRFESVRRKRETSLNQKSVLLHRCFV